MTARSPESRGETLAFLVGAIRGPVFGRVRRCAMAAANDRAYVHGKAVLPLARRM